VQGPECSCSAEAAIVRRIFGWFVHDGWNAARLLLS